MTTGTSKSHYFVPCRVISRAPGLKLVVQTLLSSLRPIGNIVLICCTFFIIFGILGVQVRNLYTEKQGDVCKSTVIQDLEINGWYKPNYLG